MHSSAFPAPYDSALSKKLHPASNAAKYMSTFHMFNQPFMHSNAVSSSTDKPQVVHAPKLRADTRRPLVHQLGLPKALPPAQITILHVEIAFS